MSETRKKAMLLIIWAAAMPLASAVSAPFWYWLAAAQANAAPCLLLGHFLFALAALLFWFGHPRAGVWVAALGAVFGVLAALSALATISGIGRGGAAVPLGDGARDFLYLLHGAYGFAHYLAVLGGFRGDVRPVAAHPA